MYSDSPDSLTASSSPRPLLSQASYSPKPPQAVWDNIFAFPPNRDTLGGTAYLIVENAREFSGRQQPTGNSRANILIDCPVWDEVNQNFLRTSGGVQWLFLTHRGGIGKTREIQETFGCEVLIQEQEAYLLPGLRVTTFQQEFSPSPSTQTIWTPGHSPGSSCLYYTGKGGVLFSGRHLLPNQLGEAVPLRTAKTFHWPRQLKSVQLLLERFTPETLQYICPGANTGFLRGKQVMEQAYHRLASLNLAALLQSKPLI